MHFNFSQLSSLERYRLLTSLVVPRPIAWVTTLDPQGRVNAAPFSFFNVFGSDPAIVVLGIGDRSNGEPKDTVRNISATGSFVVNTVTDALANQMVQTSFEYAQGESELTAVGLNTETSILVAPPRIAASPAALECTLVEIHLVGANRLIIGEVVHATIQDQYYDTDEKRVLTPAMGIVGRMHGADGYARTSDQFQIPRPSQP